MEELEKLRAGWRKLCSCGFTASELAEHWHKLRSYALTASELVERWRARTGRYERTRAAQQQQGGHGDE